MTAQTRRTAAATAGAGLLLGATFGLGGAHRPGAPAGPSAAAQTIGQPVAPAAADDEVRLVIEELEGAPPGVPPAFYFEPTGLAIAPGQTVRFRALTPHHTVTAYHAQHVKPMRVPAGVPPFSSPVIPVGESWTHTFTRPGVYDLWCAPHEPFGMAMRLVVGEASGPATEPPTDFSPAGAFGAAGAVLSDPALAPARILDRGTVSWAELDAASKQPQPPPVPGAGG